MDIIEREFARLNGLKTYYTGKLCRNGHLSYRYTSSAACAECINGSKVTDLRRVGLPPEVIAIERQERKESHAGQVVRAEQARAEHNARVAAISQVQAEVKEMERQREEARRDLHLVNIAAVPDDLKAMRDYAVFMSRACCPALQYDDIIRGDHFKGGVQYRVWVPLECKDLVDAEWNRLYKVRCAVEAPWDGVLTREYMQEHFHGWYIIANDLYYLGDEKLDVQMHDGEQLTRLEGRWYRDWEIERLLKNTLDRVEPVGDSWVPPEKI